MERVSYNCSTCWKRAVVTLVSVDAAAMSRLQACRIASTARPWPFTVELYVNYTYSQHTRTALIFCYSKIRILDLHTGWAKKWHSFFVYLITSPNINRFSKFFHCQNQETICNETFTTDPITPQMCRYTTS